jgi:hypothetical protein
MFSAAAQAKRRMKTAEIGMSTPFVGEPPILAPRGGYGGDWW